MTVLTIDDTVLIHKSRGNISCHSYPLMRYIDDGLKHRRFLDCGWAFADPIDYRNVSPLNDIVIDVSNHIDKMKRDIVLYVTNYGCHGEKPIILTKENRISMKTPDGVNREFLPDGKTFVIFLKKYSNEYLLVDYEHIKSLNKMDKQATSVVDLDDDGDEEEPNRQSHDIVPQAYLNKIKAEWKYTNAQYLTMEHRISFINALGDARKTYTFNQPIHLKRMPLYPKRILINECYVCEYVKSTFTGVEEIIFYFRDKEFDYIHPIGIVPYKDIEEYLPRKLFSSEGE